MTDYIRKAVELADGWSVSKTGQTITSGGGYFGNIEDQETLDALAAQLVRQVDALFPDIAFCCDFGGCVMLYKDRTDEDWHAGNCDKGQDAKKEDRTMNTIKAIVDSEVLE